MQSSSSSSLIVLLKRCFSVPSHTCALNIVCPWPDTWLHTQPGREKERDGTVVESHPRAQKEEEENREGGGGGRKQEESRIGRFLRGESQMGGRGWSDGGDGDGEKTLLSSCFLPSLCPSALHHPFPIFLCSLVPLPVSTTAGIIPTFIITLSPQHVSLPHCPSVPFSFSPQDKHGPN